jgi:hypothetical protein
VKAGSFSRLEQIALVAAVLVTAAVFLAPILRTPLMGDDAFNSSFTGFMGAQHIGAWQWYLEYTREVAVTNGRFFPGMALIQVVKFTLTHDALPLKIANILAICLNIATFFFLVKRLATTRIALLASLLAVAVLQERAFYESITEITVENQVVLELIFLTLLAAVAYAKRPTAKGLAVLTILYVISNATYEISYPFVFAYVGIAVAYREWTAARRALIALGSVFVFFVALNVVLRHVVGIPTTSEYAIRPDVLHYGTTLFDQIASAFPLTYILSNPGGFFTDRRAVVFGVVRVGALVGLAATVVGLVILFRRRARDGDGACVWNQRPAWFTGFCLLVLPGVLIALSVRWQQEIKFGLPYQPAYAEGFGAALLLALAAEAVLRALPRQRAGVAVAIAAVIGFTVLATYQANAKVYQIFSRSWLYPLQVLTGAEQRGALSSVPEGSTILFDSNYGFQESGSGYSGTGSQIYMYTHRRYVVWVLGDANLKPSTLCAGNIQKGACGKAIPGLYYFRVRGTGPDQGTAIALHVQGFDVPDRPGDVITPRGSTVTLYASGKQVQPLGTGFTWTPVAENDGYRLWSGRSVCGGYVAAPAAEPGQDVAFVFGHGFYPEENNAVDNWYWASSESRLSLVNNTDRPQSAEARIFFQTYAPGSYTVQIRDGKRLITLPLSRKPTVFAIARSLRPGESDRFELSTNGERASASDPRDLRLQAFHWSVRSVAGACR